MSKTWLLTDTTRGRWEESIFLGHDELGVPDFTVYKKTLRGGPQDGIDIVEVNNGELSFSVLPSRGMGIWKGSFRGIPLGWNAPVRGPVHPKFVDLQERGGLGWLYGFDELVCRCGLDSNGAPGKDVVIDNNGNPAEVDLTLHGRIANLPAHYLEVRADPATRSVSIVGHVDESALFCPGLRLKSTITTSTMSNRLAIADEIENIKATPSEMQVLYHCNFGEPFLDGGARLLAPVREVAPRDPRAAEGIADVDTYLPPTAGYVEQVYFYDLHADAVTRKSVVALRNAARDRAVAVRFDKSQLPCFTQWKNTAATADGYVTGLEPGTNYPNVKRTERDKGRVVKIDPGGSYRCDLALEVHAGHEEVAKLEREIVSLAGGAAPTVHSKPTEKYSG